MLEHGVKESRDDVLLAARALGTPGPSVLIEDP
jgi:hypothetical protein